MCKGRRQEDNRGRRQEETQRVGTGVDRRGDAEVGERRRYKR
jgi:hypothetical protein